MRLQRLVNFAVAFVAMYAALLVLSEAVVVHGWASFGYGVVASVLGYAAVFCAVTPPMDRRELAVRVRFMGAEATVRISPPATRRGEPRTRALGSEGPHRHDRLY